MSDKQWLIPIAVVVLLLGVITVSVIVSSCARAKNPVTELQYIERPATSVVPDCTEKQFRDCVKRYQSFYGQCIAAGFSLAYCKCVLVDTFC